MTEIDRSSKGLLSTPVMGAVFFLSFAISLALPNIVYSGVYFFQTLHLMKWAVALVPVAVAALITGILLAWKGAERVGFRIDLFGWIWFGLLVYVTVQPLWAPIRSVPTFYREWFFFAGLWGFYVLCLNGFRDSWLRPVVWLSSLNATANVFFAELQTINKVDVFGPLNLILPTPGNYIGNTGQQNMFGLWMAITALGSIFIYLRHGLKDTRGVGRFLSVTNLIMFPVILWGLWNSTSRSAILSLFVGLFVMAVIIITGRDRSRLRRLGISVMIVLAALVASVMLNHNRSGAIISKAVDLMENADTIGGRKGIWRTSWTMATTSYVRGVGLGQYKLNYLDAQRDAFKRYPDMEWQYTNWAHNEYLQWLCEAGIAGFAVLMGLGVLWLWAFFRYMAKHRGSPFPDGVLWGCSFLFMIWFNALWTRPFHRIENSLWLSLAFALANREIMADWTFGKLQFLKNPRGYRAMGIVMASVSLWGMSYLWHGIDGDVYLRKAMATRTAPIQRSLLETASSSLMVRDLADRQLAYHYISYGEAAKDPEALAEGLNRLFSVFRSEPTAEDLRKLLDWAGRLKKQEILQYLVMYLKPGTFSIEKR